MGHDPGGPRAGRFEFRRHFPTLILCASRLRRTDWTPWARRLRIIRRAVCGVAALGACAIGAYWNYERCTAIAGGHNRMGGCLEAAADLLPPDKVSAGVRDEIRWHAAMEARYLRAAWVPPLLIVPDPPAPDRPHPPAPAPARKGIGG